MSDATPRESAVPRYRARCLECVWTSGKDRQFAEVIANRWEYHRAQSQHRRRQFWLSHSGSNAPCP